MSRGRKPLPTETLRARGSWRANLRGEEPTAPAGVPECPDELKGEARAEWFRIAGLLGQMRILTLADRSGLLMYCRSWGRMAKALEKLEAEGEVIASTKGYPMQSAWLPIYNKAQEQATKLLTEFGLTPASRARVKASPEKKGVGLASFRLNGASA